MTLRWKVNLFSWTAFLILIGHIGTGPADTDKKDVPEFKVAHPAKAPKVRRNYHG